MYRLAVPLLTLVLLTTYLPVVSAAQAPPGDLAVWTGDAKPTLLRTAPGLGTGPDLGEVQRALVFLDSLGDISGDGHVELVMETIDPQRAIALYQAVAGPALDEVLWTVQGTAGQVMLVVGDLDADGVQDLLLVTLNQAGEAVGQAVGGIGAQRFTAAGEVVFEPLSGAAASAFFAASVATQLDATGLVAPVMGLAELAVDQVEQQAGAAQAMGFGTVMVIQETVTTTQAGLTVLATQLTDGVTEVAAQVQVMDLTGKVMAQVDLDLDGMDVVALAASQLTGDEVPMLLALLVEKVVPTDGLPVNVPELRAYAGATGQLAWSLRLDELVGTVHLVPVLGDVVGNGVSELGILEIVQDGAIGAEFASRFHIVSGVDGRLLGTLEAQAGLVAAVPFGDALPLAGGDEILKIVTDSVDGALRQVALLDSALKVVWSLDLPTGTIPINQVTDPLTGAVTGFADWVGDGIPDLAVAIPSQGGRVEVRVYAGADASLVWSKVYEGVQGLAVLESLNGMGDAELAIIHETLGDAYNLALTIAQAADGLPIWRLPLVPAELREALPSATQVLATVKSVGDITGDGIPDLVARVEFRFDGDADAVLELHGQEVAVSADAAAHTLLLDGRTGATLWADSDEVVAGELRAPLVDRGEAEPLEAYQALQAAADEGRRLSMGFGIFLVALAGLVILVRRRGGA